MKLLAAMDLVVNMLLDQPALVYIQSDLVLYFSQLTKPRIMQVRNRQQFKVCGTRDNL